MILQQVRVAISVGEPGTEPSRDISAVVDAVSDLGMTHGAAALLTARDGADLAPDVNALRTDVAHLDVVIQKLRQ